MFVFVWLNRLFLMGIQCFKKGRIHEDGWIMDARLISRHPAQRDAEHRFGGTRTNQHIPYPLKDDGWKTDFLFEMIPFLGGTC